MDLKFEVSGRIARPVDEVFEAVVNTEKLSGYFTTGGAKGRLETGTTLMWDFHDFPGAFPMRDIEVEKHRRIILRWDANEGGLAEGEAAMTTITGYKTTVPLRFEDLGDGRTLVSIAEEGWRPTPGGLAASYGNCMGWSQMICAMKMWIEHGINLRDGMYR